MTGAPRLRHARWSSLLESPNAGSTTRCLCCRSARGLINLLSTNEEGGGGELEDDCRCFFFAATALVLRDRSSFGDGDRDDNRRLFLDTVTTAVFLERSSDGDSFLLAATAFLLAASALVRGNCGSFDGSRFLNPVASMSSMPSMTEQSTFPADSLALAYRVFPLFGRTDTVPDTPS